MPDDTRGGDKRDSVRLELPGAVPGSVTILQPTTVHEISHGGMQIETTFPLQLESLHDFRLTLEEASVVVKGRVVHCHVSDVGQELVTYRSGIEFIEPSPPVTVAIARFVALVETSRRGI